MKSENQKITDIAYGLLILCGMVSAIALMFKDESPKYVSKEVQTICEQDCPGPSCLCIQGVRGYWYLNPTVGDVPDE